MGAILVFIESKGDEVRKASVEVLGEAVRAAGGDDLTVEAVCCGKISEVLKKEVLSRADKLVHLADPTLEDYSPEGYSIALATYARQSGAKIILAGATVLARDFLPRTAVLLEAGMASDVTEIRWECEPLACIRPMFGGKVFAEVSFVRYPAIVAVRPNSFPLHPALERRGEYLEVKTGVSPDQIRTSRRSAGGPGPAKVDLTEADLIVAGGRGLREASNFRILEELAVVIGASVGATRSVVDAKWRDQSDQIGKSGKTVSPKLYIAAGI